LIYRVLANNLKPFTFADKQQAQRPVQVSALLVCKVARQSLVAGGDRQPEQKQNKKQARLINKSYLFFEKGITVSYIFRLLLRN